VALEPFKSDSLVNAPDPEAVVTSKLESVAVSARIKPISLASVVVMMFPPL